MKKIYLVIFSLILCLCYSCSDMLDNVQGYLDEGEKVYVGKLDSLKAFSGDNRILIEGQMIYGVNQVKCEITWKNPISLMKETREFSVTRTSPREAFEFVLDNLEEGQYDFAVYTYDAKGNKSIPTQVSAYAYGTQYKETLINRIVRDITPAEAVDANGTLTWNAVIDWNISRGDGIVSCELEYETESGNLKKVEVPVNEVQTILADFKAGGILKYSTKYLPEETAIDLFSTAQTSIKLPQKNYVGITKDITSNYIKNAGHPFTGHSMEGNWGQLNNWSWNDVIRTKNGAGGAGFATYNGGIIQFESTRWDQGTFANGKVWQTVTLPPGRYELRIEVANAANQGSGGHKIRFAVVKGISLPDNEGLDVPDNKVLSSFQFQRNHVIETTPTFELTESTQVTLGWVVSFSETHRNIEFKSIRLWSVN